jgi:hypothetical protein
VLIRVHSWLILLSRSVSAAPPLFSYFFYTLSPKPCTLSSFQSKPLLPTYQNRLISEISLLLFPHRVTRTERRETISIFTSTAQVRLTKGESLFMKKEKSKGLFSQLYKKAIFYGLVDEGGWFPQMLASRKTTAEYTKLTKISALSP